jgi:outer membrane scaffolding protein for murein synthesis (MipA/OmpV family)
MRRANQHAGITGLAAFLLWAGCGPGWAQAATTPTRFEGAVGFALRQGPAFAGSSESRYGLTPAGFLRYGRITLNGSGGFTTRDADEVERGLAAELARRGTLRLRLGLRIDGGRSASDSPELAGTGDIRRTVRTRWSARWDPNPQWRVTAGVSADLLGRGGGFLGDLAATRVWNLGPGESLALNVGLGAAGKRYMQNWHGVTAAQSLDSGLPAFEASAGLRDLHVSVGWRTEFQAWGQPFGASLGAGYTRMLGSAADSPLTRRPGYATASGAVVWRF